MCSQQPSPNIDDVISNPHPELRARPCRVLLADDNRDAVQALTMLLEMEGFATCMAYDGVEAVEAALQFRPDVAILDIDMPGLTGYEVAQRFRRIDPMARLPLIALAGRGSAEERLRALEAGFDVHLTKPCDPVEVIELLARLHTRDEAIWCSPDSGQQPPAPACTCGASGA